PLFEKESFEKELKTGKRLAEIAARHGKSLAQLAIAWVLSNPAVSVALVGMRNNRELKENVAAADWRLNRADKAEIDRVFEEESVPTYVDEPQKLVSG
ncbi:MAG: aldo/keto reductase, partial [Spirochaetales bacterium]|nr:aldo/keto reductase [Spirochaetales bacterium]